MKNIFKIYIRDIKRICTNWAAMIMVLIMILIPSLYSLINIEASWDPYANTDGIKIAVVNKDEGTVYKEQDLNLGEELIEKLEDNDKMNWQFVDEETASKGLLEENYYATVVIPEDFSECVTTLMDKEVVKPKLIYTVNEKKNAIAPKLTDAGVKSVKNQLDDNIVKTVTGIMFRIIDETGVEIEGKRSDIRDIINKIYDLDEELPQIESILDNSINGITDVRELMLKTDDIIPAVSEVLDLTNDFVNNSDYLIDKMKGNLDDISPRIKEDLVLSQQLIDNAGVTLDNLDENVLPDSAKKSLILLSETAVSTKVTVTEVRGMLKSTKEFLKKIIDYDMPKIDIDDPLVEEDEGIKKIQAELDKQRDLFEDIQDSLKTMNKSITIFMDKLDIIGDKLDILIRRTDDEIEKIENGEGLDTQTLTDLRANVKDLNTLVSDILDSYDSEIVNGVDSGFDSIKYILSGTVEVLKEGQEILPHLEEILSASLDTVDYSGEKLADLKEKFPDVKDKVREVADKLREMDEDDQFNEIIDMITNNWGDQSEFMSSPVEIEDHRLFPWPNYGSSSAPFYIVLCIWVGALIASALMSFKAEPIEEGIELKPYEVYFGKLLIFLTITILGAVVATCGALFWLDVYTVHPLMLIMYSIFVAVVFTIIIYTAASLLDDAGKAAIVAILVVQMAGTSGTFPIEVTPPIFHEIYNYLPFTYATNGMRQIMAGITYPILIKDIKILSIYMVGALLMGAFLKGPMNKGTDMIMDKLSKSGILRH